MEEAINCAAQCNNCYQLSMFTGSAEIGTQQQTRPLAGILLSRRTCGDRIGYIGLPRSQTLSYQAALCTRRLRRENFEEVCAYELDLPAMESCIERLVMLDLVYVVIVPSSQTAT